MIISFAIRLDISGTSVVVDRLFTQLRHYHLTRVYNFFWENPTQIAQLSLPSSSNMIFCASCPYGASALSLNQNIPHRYCILKFCSLCIDLIPLIGYFIDYLTIIGNSHMYRAASRSYIICLGLFGDSCLLLSSSQIIPLGLEMVSLVFFRLRLGHKHDLTSHENYVPAFVPHLM